MSLVQFDLHADIILYNIGLREHLLAAGASGSGPAPYPASSAPAPPENSYQPSDSASPHDHYDHAGGSRQQYGMSGDGDGDGDDGLSPDARKGKRELSTSKRAAQNRAAQVQMHSLKRNIP